MKIYFDNEAEGGSRKVITMQYEELTNFELFNAFLDIFQSSGVSQSELKDCLMAKLLHMMSPETFEMGEEDD